MRDESVFFKAWLLRQGDPGILPNQWSACMKVMKQLEPADLISILYHGDKDHALKALHYLKEKFLFEMYVIEEMLKQQEAYEDAIDRY